MNKIGAIVLAGGEGKRMKSKIVNKVVLLLGNREMILHTIEILENFKISPIIVVVGFAKQSVIDVLGDRVTFTEQKERLGTGHAVSCGLKKLNENVEDVLVLNGDDSAFYKKETIARLIKKHQLLDCAITFLTIKVNNPKGLGRVVRDSKGKVVAIVEEKDADLSRLKTQEINPGCFVFDLGFLDKYLGKIKKSGITGEYYLTSLVDIAIKNNEKVETSQESKIYWRGINTPSELREADRMFLQTK